MLEKKFTESLFYEICLTAKCIKKTAEQLFKKLKIELTNEEFGTLDFLYHNEDVCQRDIAVKSLVNRANIGKILNGLEEKGYITRTLSEKCNHPVKIVSLTEYGIQIYTKISHTLKQAIKEPMDVLSEEEAKKMLRDLQKIKEVLKGNIILNI